MSNENCIIRSVSIRFPSTKLLRSCHALDTTSPLRCPRRLSGNDDMKTLPAEVYEDLLVILSERGELEVSAMCSLFFIFLSL